MKMKALESDDSDSDFEQPKPTHMLSQSSNISGKSGVKDASPIKRGQQMHGQNPHAAEYLGNPLYNDCLTDVTQAREQLFTIKKKAQDAVKKVAREKKRNKMMRPGGDDGQSVFSIPSTIMTAAQGHESQIEQGITADYAWTQGKPRQFVHKTPTLSRLGIDNFDQQEKIGDLEFTMEKATDKYRTALKTKDTEKIKQIVKLGIVREVGGI